MAFKMKGSPMQRNFGVGEKTKAEPSDTTKFNIGSFKQNLPHLDFQKKIKKKKKKKEKNPFIEYLKPEQAWS